MEVIEMARMGGNATVRKHGKAYMKALSLKGVQARKLKALELKKRQVDTDMKV